ncbi:hypothetical protein HFP89_13555 [Wenzhouxiangella sp. XN79A]|uniref:hypothetical protein n=1 Tax=Wenzhouxiangella sp. XN79A TaxID=2724193 RepID=UPI00144A91AF|nr:hypothetical protein [Wenzhouxiangella sp. XN79A]NKI36191.1 hypothetical protein [Wenzhouxiangella sp. XN79A]
MKSRLLASLALVATFAAAHAGAQTPVEYTLEWSDATGSTTASGFIVLDRDLVATPGDFVWNLPDPAVLDFEITVSGSTSGDGTFTIADYGTIIFDTNGGALDLDAELVGQPTDGDPWGTPSAGAGGDFNIFTGGGGGGGEASDDRYANPPAPQGFGGLPPEGTFFFEISANGGAGEAMLLTSFRPAGAPQATTVPTLSAAGLAVLLLTMAVVGTLVMRQRASA